MRFCVCAAPGSNWIMERLRAVASGCAVCCVLKQVETKMESICLASRESLKWQLCETSGCASGAGQSLLVFSACLTI